MRKPIQITASQSAHPQGQNEADWSLYALCDDGTMWMRHSMTGKWHQLESIPQDPETLDKCPTLAFNGINKQAAAINSALDAENERLNWKLEAARMALRNITEVGGLYYEEKGKVEYCIERARIALEDIE